MALALNFEKLAEARKAGKEETMKTDAENTKVILDFFAEQVNAEVLALFTDVKKRMTTNEQHDADKDWLLTGQKLLVRFQNVQAKLEYVIYSERLLADNTSVEECIAAKLAEFPEGFEPFAIYSYSISIMEKVTKRLYHFEFKDFATEIPFNDANSTEAES